MGKHINIHVGGLWRCKGSGTCTIERETRIHCKLCRWNACLKAGMRPEFVHNSDAAVANIRSQGVLSRSTLAKISPGLCGRPDPEPWRGLQIPKAELVSETPVATLTPDTQPPETMGLEIPPGPSLQGPAVTCEDCSHLERLMSRSLSNLSSLRSDLIPIRDEISYLFRRAGSMGNSESCPSVCPPV